MWILLDISIIVKIGIVGIVMIVLDKVLDSGGKKEYAVISNLAGIVTLAARVMRLRSVNWRWATPR